MLALVLVYAPARADGGWQIVEVDGKVHVRYGADRWVQARSGDTLFSSAEIITGSDGRAVLARGPSTIAIAPGARIELPRQDDAVPPLRKASLPGPDHQPQPAIERVFQTFGTLLYRVKPDSGRQFQVQTPYLVTTIKGTVFTVAVNTTGAAVHVTEGLVEVMPVLGGIGAMVAAGQAAIVPAERGADVEVRGRDAERAPRVHPGGGPTEETRPADAGRGGAEEPAVRGDGKPKAKESVVFVNAKGVDENGVAHLRPETADDEALRGQADLGLSTASATHANDTSTGGLGVENLLEPGGDAGSTIARDGDGGPGDGLVDTAAGVSGGADLNLGGGVDGVGGTLDGVGDLAGGGGVDLG
ncbi:MAG: FecR domain-containing protein, partial [Geminicoccales bacterium]